MSLVKIDLALVSLRPRDDSRVLPLSHASTHWAPVCDNLDQLSELAPGEKSRRRIGSHAIDARIGPTDRFSKKAANIGQRTNFVSGEAYIRSSALRLKRVIQQRIENALATRILVGEFQPGDTIVVGYAGKSFTFERRPGTGDGEPAATTASAAGS